MTTVPADLHLASGKHVQPMLIGTKHHIVTERGGWHAHFRPVCCTVIHQHSALWGVCGLPSILIPSDIKHIICSYFCKPRVPIPNFGQSKGLLGVGKVPTCCHPPRLRAFLLSLDLIWHGARVHSHVIRRDRKFAE